MKNCEKFKVGDKVKIIFSHSDDLGKIGRILEVRPSFCKILFEEYFKPRNHTYGQFEKVEEDGE